MQERKLLDSCGGIAYDHETLPKIVAVHSIINKCDIPTVSKSSLITFKNQLNYRPSPQDECFQDKVITVTSGAPLFNTNSMYLPETYSKQHFSQLCTTPQPGQGETLSGRNLTMTKELTEYQILQQNTPTCLMEIENYPQISQCATYTDSTDSKEYIVDEIEQELTSGVSPQDLFSENISTSSLENYPAHNHLTSPTYSISVKCEVDEVDTEKRDTSIVCSQNVSDNTSPTGVEVGLPDKSLETLVIPHNDRSQLFSSNSASLDSSSTEKALQVCNVSSREVPPSSMERNTKRNKHKYTDILSRTSDISIRATESNSSEDEQAFCKQNTPTESAISVDPTHQQGMDDTTATGKKKLRFLIIKQENDSPTNLNKTPSVCKSACQLKSQCHAHQLKVGNIEEKISNLTKLGWSVSSAINVLSRRGEIGKRNGELTATSERDHCILTEEILRKLVIREKLRKRQISKSTTTTNDVNDAATSQSIYQYKDETARTSPFEMITPNANESSAGLEACTNCETDIKCKNGKNFSVKQERWTGQEGTCREDLDNKSIMENNGIAFQVDINEREFEEEQQSSNNVDTEMLETSCNTTIQSYANQTPPKTLFKEQPTVISPWYKDTTMHEQYRSPSCSKTSWPSTNVVKQEKINNWTNSEIPREGTNVAWQRHRDESSLNHHVQLELCNGYSWPSTNVLKQEQTNHCFPSWANNEIPGTGTNAAWKRHRDESSLNRHVQLELSNGYSWPSTNFVKQEQTNHCFPSWANNEIPETSTNATWQRHRDESSLNCDVQQKQCNGYSWPSINIPHYKQYSNPSWTNSEITLPSTDNVPQQQYGIPSWGTTLHLPDAQNYTPPLENCNYANMYVQNNLQGCPPHCYGVNNLTSSSNLTIDTSSWNIEGSSNYEGECPGSSKYGMYDKWTIQKTNTAESQISMSEKEETNNRIKDRPCDLKRDLELKETEQEHLPAKRPRKSTPKKLLKFPGCFTRNDIDDGIAKRVGTVTEKLNFNNSLSFDDCSAYQSGPPEYKTQKEPHNCSTSYGRPKETTTMVDCTSQTTGRYKVKTSLNREERIKKLLSKQNQLLSKINM